MTERFAITGPGTSPPGGFAMGPSAQGGFSMGPSATRELAVYGAHDVPWIASIVDEVERGIGQPWRIVLDRLERLPLPAPRINAVVSALRRLDKGRATTAAAARRARSIVLGPPALDPAARSKRIGDAAVLLDITPGELETMLWSDLAGERAVALPNGRPAELVIAALANERKIRRVLARAESIVLRVWGDARPIVRAAAARGLIASITAGASGETTFDVCGPLALVHNTTVYGRALAGFVPQLAACDRFELDVRCDFGHGSVELHLASPIMLPVAPAQRRWKLVDKLAKELEHRGVAVVRDPPPVVAGCALAFPDLVVDGTFVEIVGFWTEAFLTAKLARYREAGVNVVLCAALVANVEAPVGVVVFDRTVSADAVLTAREPGIG